MDRTNAVDLVKGARAGSHYCLFYQSPDDLTGLLSEYFKSGIEKGDFCIWITSDGGVEEKARAALQNTLPSSLAQQAGTQIEFIPYSDWYLRGGAFQPDQVIKSWMERMNLALNLGYRGLRVTGDLSWMDCTDWPTLMAYESDINRIIGGLNFMAVCSYPLPALNASRMMDVINRHQAALSKNDEQWHTFNTPAADVAAVDGTIHAAIAGKQALGAKASEYPVLLPENCDGCGLCVDVCSSGSLYLNNGRIALKPVGECDWCAVCEAVCLSNAIFCPFEITAEL
ncbi:MAG: MEDS domain-containing protein [Dehalococcoidia bacterium]|nr:MEDS domain-containing protein [Dehalococcoidia bacterium]